VSGIVVIKMKANNVGLCVQSTWMFIKNAVISFPKICICISLFHRAFQFTIYNGPTNALVCNKTLIQMSQTKTLKITPTCFDHQIIIIREIFDPG
jgi:hypothetical protein